MDARIAALVIALLSPTRALGADGDDAPAVKHARHTHHHRERPRHKAPARDAHAAGSTKATTAPPPQPPREVRAPSPAETPSPLPAAPAAPPAPALVAPATATEGTTSEGAPSLVRVFRSASPRPMLALSADAGLGAHRVQYTQNLTQNLRTSESSAVPLAGFHVQWYPLAWTRLRGARDLGLVADFARSIGARARFADSGASVDTVWQSFDAGLRLRIRTGDGPRPLIGVEVDYGGLDFSFLDRGQIVAGTPSVAYRYVRPALDLGVTLGRFRLFAAGAYRAVLSAGSLAAFFPHGTVGGIDVSAGGAVRIVPHLEALVAVEYDRFFYDFRPQPGDAVVAGGALDEFLSARVMLAYSL